MINYTADEITANHNKGNEFNLVPVTDNTGVYEVNETDTPELVSGADMYEDAAQRAYRDIKFQGVCGTVRR